MFTEEEIREMHEEAGGEECATFEEFVSAFFQKIGEDLYIETEESKSFRAWLFGDVYPELTVYC